MQAAAAPRKATKKKKTANTFAKAMKAVAPRKAMKKNNKKMMKNVTTFAKAMMAAMKAMK